MDINKLIDDSKKVRISILNTISSLSAAQLNEIPAGFNNNIIWNIAHIVASQQGLTYFRSGLEMPVGDDYFKKYKSETKPEEPVSEGEIEKIKEFILSSIDQFKKDYSEALFSNFQSFTSRYGIEFNNIEEVIPFVTFHDGIHFGYVMALKRVISKNI